MSWVLGTPFGLLYTAFAVWFWLRGWFSLEWENANYFMDNPEAPPEPRVAFWVRGVFYLVLGVTWGLWIVPVVIHEWRWSR